MGFFDLLNITINLGCVFNEKWKMCLKLSSKSAVCDTYFKFMYLTPLLRKIKFYLISLAEFQSKVKFLINSHTLLPSKITYVDRDELCFTII